jgi:hypothetical protein
MEITGGRTGMSDRFEVLAEKLVAAVLHSDSGMALAVVALAALGVAALSLWALTVVVKAMTRRR